jgi:hypothetical protein
MEVFSCPQPAVRTYSFSPDAVWMCTLYPSQSLLLAVLTYRLQGVSFSPACCMDVQCVSINTIISVYVQSVSIFAVSSVDVKGVSLSYVSKSDLQGVSLTLHRQQYKTGCRVYPSPFYCYVFKCRNVGLYGIRSVRYRNDDAGSSPVPE